METSIGKNRFIVEYDIRQLNWSKQLPIL